MFVVYITCTSNNFFLNVTKKQGRVLCWQTAGLSISKGIKKQSPLVLDELGQSFIYKIIKLEIKKFEVIIRGFKSTLILLLSKLIKLFIKFKLNITKLIIQSSFPHNGCKSPKKRRL